MSSKNHLTRGVQNAKKKALNDAVWLPPKMRAKQQQHDIASSQCNKASSQCDTASSVEGEPQWGSHPRSKPKPMKSQSRLAEEDKVETQRQSPDSDSEQLEEPRWGSQPRTKSKPNKKHRQDEAKAVKYKHCRHTCTHQLKSIKEDRSVEQSEIEEADDDGDQTNFDGTDSSLSDFEDPKSIVKMLSTEIPSFISSTKAKNQAVTADKQSACACKRATETPMWADDLLSESEESRDEPAPKSDSDTSIFVKSEQDSSDAEHMGSESSSHHSGSSDVKLILTDNAKVKNAKVKNAKVKMTDQDPKTRNVIQGSILEAKAYMAFINGYPELIEKNSFSRDALLKLKLTYHYFVVNSRMMLAANYHYSMQFGVHFEASADDNAPKLGDIIVNIMKGRYFNGSKSVGVVFAHKFTEITKNKANRPEVSIPMVALTSTLVYAALFWKAQGSLPKFNFTGNQFSEVYVFHVQFLEDLKKNAPQKFHKLMVDIFAAIEALTHTIKNTGTDLKTNALAFLDLDGMDK
ncbi:hypothetical protein BDR06DRAFT_971314 [Suillus hirtellus]|nr:hypothetical protein BDR06DRAFT_971314 [Suillus hirtellus]